MESNQMQWQSLSAALEITKSALDPASLGERLGTDIDSLSATGDDLEGIFDELLPKVTPLASELTALRAEGYQVRIDIKGWVESGARLTVPAGVLAQAAELALPLSFTTQANVSTETEDFLSSLGGPPQPEES
ncbi:hypothetical protein [Streptomyces sp. NBC_01803]|uniref:hypothetical protein n=1 Tax=Streptomyces sp. NBC_01803 TaxID=2975946 RepID=UPI002DD7CCA5|nr:hypothetical protein [Streptomyces sp. NBC_01803]WSA45446.1 hypothetical protein OIE51_15285 [Streptomyces sp. NBC_01803]